MTKFVAYQRVSTREQGKSGLGLEGQAEAIYRAVSFAGGEISETYIDIESGAHNDRPELAAAIAKCRAAGMTLVVAKLDRLSRDAAYLLALQSTGLELMVADSPSMGALEYGIKAVFAEQERRQISERTIAALAAAKARGVKLGSRNIQKVSAAGVAARQAQARAHAEIILPIIERIRGLGITSLRGIAAELNERKGAETMRGGSWSAQSVKNVLALA